jgi:hypothetical protein
MKRSPDAPRARLATRATLAPIADDWQDSANSRRSLNSQIPYSNDRSAPERAGRAHENITSVAGDRPLHHSIQIH